MTALQISESRSPIPSELLLQAKHSSCHHRSYDMTSVRPTVLIIFLWMGTSSLLPFSKREALEALRGAERSRALPLFQPSRSYGHSPAWQTPRLWTHSATPTPFSRTLLLSRAPPPLGFGQLRFGAQVQGAQASVPLKLRLVGFMLLLQAVWIFLGPNSLEVGIPSQLCAVHTVAEKHDLWDWARASLSGSGEAIVQRPFAGWSFSTLQAGHHVAPVSSPTHRGACRSRAVVQKVCVYA